MTMRHLKLIALFVRTTVQTQLEYRSGVVARLAANLLSAATSILLIWAMFQRVEGVGGWSFDQVLVLVGVVYTIDFVIEVWFYPSLSPISGYVRRGEFDLLLLKPVASQFLVTFRHLQVLEATGLIVGIAIMGVGMHRLETVTALNILLLVVFLAVALTIIYSVYLALSTLAFWFTRVEEVASVIWLFSWTGTFPISAYPAWARIVFTFVLPVAFVSNVPAQAATGRLTWDWALGAIGFAAMVLAASSWLWGRAIRSYSSASS